MAHLSIQAAELGLHVHQMAGFDAQKARELFEIPADYVPTTVVALGYLGSAEDLPEELRQREAAPAPASRSMNLSLAVSGAHP